MATTGMVQYGPPAALRKFSERSLQIVDLMEPLLPILYSRGEIMADAAEAIKSHAFTLRRLCRASVFESSRTTLPVLSETVQKIALAMMWEQAEAEEELARRPGWEPRQDQTSAAVSMLCVDLVTAAQGALDEEWQNNRAALEGVVA